MLSLPSDFIDLLSSNKANLALILVPLASLAFFYLNADSDDAQRPASPTPTATQEQPKTLMQAPSADLAPPKDDPFTLESLKEYDGTDESKPIYVSIKGVFAFDSHIHSLSCIDASFVYPSSLLLLYCHESIFSHDGDMSAHTFSHHRNRF